MSNVAISDLPVATVINATDIIPFVQPAVAGTTKTITKTLLFTSPTMVTPNIGAATGTSLALTGLATVGTTLGVTGVSTLTGGATVPTSAVGNVFSSTYTPTITIVANVSATTATVTSFCRVGNFVTVAGEFNIDPIAVGYAEVQLTLPVASTFISSRQLGGVGAEWSTNTALSITCDTSTYKARFLMTAINVANQTITFQFGYLVV